MAIDLKELERSAQRFSGYAKAIGRVRKNRRKITRERIEVRARHIEQFTPASERLFKAQQAIVVVPLPTETVPAGPPEPSPVDTIAGLIPPEPMVLVGGLVPEAMFRDNDLRPIRFLNIGLIAARAVGKVAISDSPITEDGDATGFMVAPGLLMTNWHVLRSADHAAAASVIFDDEDGVDGNPLETKAFRLRPDLLFVNDEELDYAIVAVASRTSSGTPLAQYGYLPLYRQTGKLDPTQRQAANIVQHPGGGRKKIAIRDNYVLEVVPDTVDPAKKEISLFYGTDTLKGSSGSPVFSDQWFVVALHRGGVPETKMIDGKRVVIRRSDGQPATVNDSKSEIRFITNEGTRISRIYHSLEQKSPTEPHAAIALERLSAVAKDPKNGPVSVRTAPIVLPSAAAAEEGGVEEITRRSKTKFEGSPGYRPAFLGTAFRVPLPAMTSDVKRELATLKNSTKTELKYANYSVRMNKERRTAVYVAANIEGSQLWRNVQNTALPARPQWSYDPRMEDRYQPDDSIFGNSMQRGHLFKREDAVWGSDLAGLKRADEHSFTITNATPMIRNFNNVEWGDLEDIVTEEGMGGNRLSYFAGPIFRSTDPYFNELRRDLPAGAELRSGMRVPQAFWKVVFWVEGSKLRAAGFVLYQTDEIEIHGPIDEEINFGTYMKTRISEIEQATGLRFPKLAAADTIDE